MDDSISRARGAGRRFASTAAQTGLAGGGGLVYYGAHALITPSLYGTDSQNIPKRAWIVPTAGIVGGALLTMAPKISSIGLGIVGGAVAIGAEQLQMAITIKKNAAASAPAAQTSGVGSLLEPGDLRAAPQLASPAGVGALYQPPEHARNLVQEAAGLSV